MRSNLPEELAVYNFRGGRGVFSFYLGSVLRHDHQTLTHVTHHPGSRVVDIYGQVLRYYPGYTTEHQTFRGTILLRTVTGQEVTIDYREPRLDCNQGHDINAVFCNDRFVGFENYNTRLRHTFGFLYRHTGGVVGKSDFLGFHPGTLMVGCLALWASGLFYDGSGLLLLRWNPGVYAPGIVLEIVVTLIAYAVVLALINPIIAMTRRPRAKKRLQAIFDFVSVARSNHRVPAQWNEIRVSRKMRSIATASILVIALISLLPVGFTYMLYRNAVGIPHPPAFLSLAAWLGVVTAGILLTWGLARIPWVRILAWGSAFATGLFVYSVKPDVVVKAIMPDVRWLQMGTHFLWLAFSLGMAWALARSSRTVFARN